MLLSLFLGGAQELLKEGFRDPRPPETANRTASGLPTILHLVQSLTVVYLLPLYLCVLAMLTF